MNDTFYLGKEECLQDIAESLRIISGRSTLKENRLREEIKILNGKLGYTYDVDECNKILKEIDKLENEIYQDRLKREKGGKE